MLKRNLIANYLGQGWTALMNFLFIPLYIKYLGIEAYGLIGLFAVLTAWFSLLDMGMSPTLGREMALFKANNQCVEGIRDLLRSCEWVGFSLAGVMVIVMTQGSQWLANSWLNSSTLSVLVVSQAISIMGFVIALRFIEGIYRAALIGLQHQVSLNVVNALMATFRGLGVLGVLVWVSPTIQAFFWWQAFLSVLSLAILSFLTYQRLPKGNRSGRFSLSRLRKIWRFASGITAITVLSMLSMQGDKILLSKFVGLNEFGYYMVAASVAAALFIFAWPIIQAYYPRLCQLLAAKDHERFVLAYHQGSQLIGVIVGSIALNIILFTEPLLNLWTRNADLSARVAPILSLLVFGNFISSVMFMPYQAQLAYGYTGSLIKMHIAAIVIFLPVFIFIVPQYGGIGAAAVWLCINFFYILVGGHLMHKRVLHEEKIKWYRYALLQPVLFGVIIIYLINMLIPVPSQALSQVIYFSVTTAFVIMVLATLSPQIISVFKGKFF